MPGLIYVLDTNVFIEAARRYYAFDIAPSFWKKLEEQAKNGRIISIDRVKDELDKGNDELKEWANKIFAPYFVPTQVEEIFEAYQKIIQWVRNHNQFMESAKDEFADSADGWIIAYVMQNHECIVVTHENYNSYIKKRVPIPNVCEQFNVPYTDTFEMLRGLGIQL